MVLFVAYGAIVGDFFGRDRAGAIVGFIFMLAGCTSAAGPVAAGAIYDRTGSYTIAFAVSAGLNVVALVMLALTRRPRA